MKNNLFFFIFNYSVFHLYISKAKRKKEEIISIKKIVNEKLNRNSSSDLMMCFLIRSTMFFI